MVELENAYRRSVFKMEVGEGAAAAAAGGAVDPAGPGAVGGDQLMPRIAAVTDDIKFPEFQGTSGTERTGKALDPTAWLLHVDGIIQQYDLKPEAIMGAVKRCFFQKALDWYVGLELERNAALTSWETFRPAFMRRFKVSMTYAQKSALQASLRQRDNESANDFLDRVRRVILEMFKPCCPELVTQGDQKNISKWKSEQHFLVMTELIKISFISGLRDEARKACEQGVNNSTSLLDVGEMAEAAEQAARKTQRTQVAAVGKEENEFSADVAAVGRGGGRGRGGRRGGARGRGRGAAAGGTAGGKQKPKQGSFRDDGRPNFLELPNGDKVWKCWRCGGYGQHSANQCPMPEGKVATVANPNQAETEEEEEDLNA